MCGIAGIWGPDVDASLVRTMMGRLAHRGPDGRGTHRDKHGMLGHVRLAIMDPAHGDQPIHEPGGRRVIVANGEIYNFRSLNSEMTGRHRIRTRSDSESALHVFADTGPAAAHRFDGMFAIAIADGPDLYLARDPIGIKPLYYARDGERLVFASELKAFDGIFTGVREFPPGTWFHTSHGFHPYYTVPDRVPEPMALDRRLRLLRETLEQAVAKRMMSDVPLGAFLSGGLDSSLIAAIARPHVDELHTFSVGVEGSGDLEAARVVARHLDTVHHEYVITPEQVRRELPQIIYHLESFDQDLVRSAIPCYFTSRLAAEHVKVILTGEGADELFAGYSYYRDLGDPAALHAELRRSVCSLHNVNLQRVDRLTMAHGIEGRVPFLDVDLIELAQTIPTELKLFEREGRPSIEKWVLRKACEDLLPHAILWRDKLQFDEGSGTVDIVAEALQGLMSEAQARRYAQSRPVARLRSSEECAYHQMLANAYVDADGMEANVARWSERPEPIAAGSMH